MTPIGLFYGTDTGFTEIVVKLFGVWGASVGKFTVSLT